MERQGWIKQGWCLKHPLHSKGGWKLLGLRLCLQFKPPELAQRVVQVEGL